jgi:prophage regulatory protein
MDTDTAPDILIRLPELRQRLGGMSRAAIYKWMLDGKFPRPVRLSSQVVAWRQRDIAEWIDRCPRSEGDPARQHRRAAGDAR